MSFPFILFNRKSRRLQRNLRYFLFGKSKHFEMYQLQFSLNWPLDSSSVQPLPIVLPLLYSLLNELPLLLPGVNNTDRVFRIGCPRVQVMSPLWYNQRRRSSDWLEHAPTGPWVQQPIAEHYVGGSFKASTAIHGVLVHVPGLSLKHVVLAIVAEGHHHLCARLVRPHASSNVILVPKVKTFALASVVEVDIEASKDVAKELLVRGMGLGQANAGFGYRVGGQWSQECCGVRVVHHCQVSPNLSKIVFQCCHIRRGFQ